MLLLWCGFFRTCRFLDINDKFILDFLLIHRSCWEVDLFINIEISPARPTTAPKPGYYEKLVNYNDPIDEAYMISGLMDGINVISRKLVVF